MTRRELLRRLLWSPVALSVSAFGTRMLPLGHESKLQSVLASMQRLFATFGQRFVYYNDYLKNPRTAPWAGWWEDKAGRVLSFVDRWGVHVHPHGPRLP